MLQRTAGSKRTSVCPLIVLAKNDIMVCRLIAYHDIENREFVLFSPYGMNEQEAVRCRL